MSLVNLVGTNPWLPLFMGFDVKDSGEAAREVSEQMDLHNRPTFRAQVNQSWNTD